VWHGGTQGEPQLLHNCYANSLNVAEQHEIRTIAFPAISTGVYGYPIEAAATVAFDAVTAHKPQVIEEVRFVLFSAADMQVYQREQAARAGMINGQRGMGRMVDS